jgi:hypothetical protein
VVSCSGLLVFKKSTFGITSILRVNQEESLNQSKLKSLLSFEKKGMRREAR